MGIIKGNFNDVCESLDWNIQNDHFNCIAITAPQRLGKSRLCYKLAQHLYPEFSYEKNYLGNPKHWESIEMISNTPDKSLIWIDEGEKILAAENRMMTEQFFLQQLFNQFASENKNVLIATPSFRKIDKRWRDVHISVWIHIYKRGCAVLLKNRNTIGSDDTWGLKAIGEYEEGIKADISSEEHRLKAFERSPATLMYFEYDDWQPEEKAAKEEYLKWKKKSQNDLKDEIKKKREIDEKLKKGLPKYEIALARIATFQKFKRNIPYERTADILGIDRHTLGKCVKTFFERISEGILTREMMPQFDQIYWNNLESELRTMQTL